MLKIQTQGNDDRQSRGLICQSKIKELCKFSNLYKEVLSNMQMEAGVKKIVDADKKFDGFLDSILKVLDYLTENKDKWFIENDILKSTDRTFIDEYNGLIKLANISAK